MGRRAGWNLEATVTVLIGAVCPNPLCAESLHGHEEICPECGTTVYATNDCSVCGDEFVITRRGDQHVCGKRKCRRTYQRWNRRELKAD